MMGDVRRESKDWTKSHQGRFEKLLETGFLSDLQIIVGDVVFHAHKLIVATGSPVLYEQIATNAKPGIQCFEDVQPRIFYKFLKFLYTGTCELRVEDALPLNQLALAYKVFDLGEKCQALLQEDLTDETAIHIYQQAVHYKDETLLKKSLHYLCRNAWSIIELNDFTNLTTDNLKRLLFCDQLLVLNETQLMRGLYRWAKKECERKNAKLTTEKLTNLLKHFSQCVRWDRVDPEKFEEPDLIDLEKLFNAFHPLDKKPKRKCKFTRKYFDDDDSSFVMSRLPQKFAYCTDNKSTEPEVLKFKTDVSICLMSIGIPAYSQTCGDFFNAKIEISENGSKSKVVVTEKVPHSKGMYHLKFFKPYKIRKDTWYTIYGTITGTPGYGNMGGKSVNHIKCTSINGTETTIKFEFKPCFGSGSNLDEIAGGQMDEFAFQLVET